MSERADPYLVAVGGHACSHLAGEADLLLDEHPLFGEDHPRLLLRPSLDQVREAFKALPPEKPVEIVTSLQGKFSLKWVPLILLTLRELRRPSELRIVPVAEGIAEFLHLPKIRVEQLAEHFDYDVAISTPARTDRQQRT